MDSSSLGAQQFHPVQENVPLPDRVAEQLRTMVLNGALRPGERLSNEPELAHALGVSRSTLRAALDRLVHDGLILRKRGIGTFVTTQHPVSTNLNVNIGATGLIRASGAKPGMASVILSQSTADDERVVERLEVSRGEPLVVVERVRTANRRPVIFAREYMPASLLHPVGVEAALAELEQFLLTEQSLHLYFKRRLGLDVQHGMARLQPATADLAIARTLDVAPGCLLMYLEQVDYGTNERPLLLSDEYWVADAFTFSVYRAS